MVLSVWYTYLDYINKNRSTSTKMERFCGGAAGLWRGSQASRISQSCGLLIPWQMQGAGWIPPPTCDSTSSSFTRCHKGQAERLDDACTLGESMPQRDSEVCSLLPSYRKAEVYSPEMEGQLQDAWAETY
mmetsp:Transcript_23474/g.51071  ORF Transcript_23474/g.51071 Transcript_23474/m.51071 type:complete len:130 (-) Transcript_23474:60-449(-)